MSELNYSRFRESLIAAIADEQEPPGLASIIIEDVCIRHRFDFHDTWVLTVAKDMENLGWGSDTSDQDGMRFLISGGGLAHADKVRADRHKPTILNQIKQLPYGSGIWEILKLTLAALLGALAASHFGTN